jgi:hypothetical protein
VDRNPNCRFAQSTHDSTFAFEMITHPRSVQDFFHS